MCTFSIGSQFDNTTDKSQSGFTSLARAEQMDDPTDDTFRQLMARVRAGDQDAALEMHQLYGEHVQRIVRVRMTNQGLRRQMDSMDICQSVFADFFVRMALGQYDLNSPSELMRLLATMARNRLFHHSDKQRAAREMCGVWWGAGRGPRYRCKRWHTRRDRFGKRAVRAGGWAIV